MVSGINENMDILLTSETKHDDSFPIRQFLIKDLSAPYTLERDSSGGRILVYVREHFVSNLIAIEFSNREGFSVEINLSKKK